MKESVMTEYTPILTETQNRLGLVRPDRPQALNAINTILLNELMDALEAFDNHGAISAMVITGNERRLSHFLFSTADQKEGLPAFTEKRPAQWQGK